MRDVCSVRSSGDGQYLIRSKSKIKLSDSDDSPDTSKPHDENLLTNIKRILLSNPDGVGLSTLHFTANI